MMVKKLAFLGTAVGIALVIAIPIASILVRGYRNPSPMLVPILVHWF